MKDLIIVGASGFGRETAWAVERQNKVTPTWNLLGFLDDNEAVCGTEINGYKVLGKTEDAARYPDAYFVCAVGSSKVREKIIAKMTESNPSPTKVERIVRTHNFFPPVATFNLESTMELENSPNR